MLFRLLLPLLYWLRSDCFSLLLGSVLDQTLCELIFYLGWRGDIDSSKAAAYYACFICSFVSEFVWSWLKLICCILMILFYRFSPKLNPPFKFEFSLGFWATRGNDSLVCFFSKTAGGSFSFCRKNLMSSSSSSSLINSSSSSSF